MASLNTRALFEKPIAHRGLHDSAAGCIENTESAFATAIKQGFAIECDVLLTKEGEAAVFHDHTLDRLMQATGPFRAHTLQELKAIPFLHTKDRIQSLAELLEQVNGQTPLIVELKSLWDGSDALAHAVAKTIRSYKGPLGVMSYDPVLAAALRRARAPFPNGLVARTFRPGGSWDFMSPFQRFKMRNFLHWPATRPDFISYYIHDLPALPVTLLRKVFNIPIICWTVRTREEMQKAALYCEQITFEGFDPR